MAIPRWRVSANADQAGFTLVEILVALAILVIGLAAVLRVAGQSIETTAALRDRAQALWIAQDRISQHRLARDWPATDSFTGRVDFGGREWRWREQVAATPLAKFRRIDVEVRLREDGQVLARVVGYLKEPG